MNNDRRTVVKAIGGLTALGSTGLMGLAHADNNAIRIGLMTVKTGPLASGGIDMERALMMYLKERNYTLAGRKVELFVADSAGIPANARSKIQEMVERNKIHVLIGPLAANEALAVDDYIRAQSLPTLSVAAAEDMTQRKANPWFVRATSTSSQCAHPMADYCAKTMKWKRVVLIADDLAYGHEMVAGFQRVFEENGGKVIQKLFPPLTVPDYGNFLAQLKTNVDGIFLGFAGSNGFRFLRQFNEFGLKGKVNVVGGMTALDEQVLKNMGDEALGIKTACWYSAELANPMNRRFAEDFRKLHGYDPGFYAAATYTNGAVIEAAIEAVKGKVEDKNALMKALRATNVKTVRGPVSFDSYGNVVGDVYIRRVERKDGRLVNVVEKVYDNVSQFWTYDPKAFLANPTYSRDYPPAKNLES
jgi:branched-chain amino acid transport system substrate-binding protein